MDLYGGVDMAKVLFGENARHVPCWMYVQGEAGLVSFVGSSRIPTGEHPLRFGSQRTHQFIVGEAIIRPHLVVATDTLRGMGLGNLAMHDHNIEEMLSKGEPIMSRGGGMDLATLMFDLGIRP